MLIHRDIISIPSDDRRENGLPTERERERVKHQNRPGLLRSGRNRLLGLGLNGERAHADFEFGAGAAVGSAVVGADETFVGTDHVNSDDRRGIRFLATKTCELKRKTKCLYDNPTLHLI